MLTHPRMQHHATLLLSVLCARYCSVRLHVGLSEHVGGETERALSGHIHRYTYPNSDLLSPCTRAELLTSHGP